VKLSWYLARSGGLVSWGLLAGSVLWGLALSTRISGPSPKPPWMLAFHRFLGALSLVFVGVHIGALVADGYIRFGPVDILIPFASSWRPVAVAWGVVSLYLLLAVEITSLMMKRISNKTWRRVHRLSFALFVFATAHTLTAGTDGTIAAVQWTTVGLTTLALFLWLFRVLVPKSSKPRRTLPPGHKPPARPARAGEPANVEPADVSSAG
jgi:DMSO/TMAO reductase YedYZ heme-binding membrane subunit